MTFDLVQYLPLIAPKAIAWGEEHASRILALGQPLTGQQLEVAQKVGVLHPERIRILLVAQLPMPDDPLLRQAAEETGLLGPDMVGLTLGYGIYFCDGYKTDRLLCHECRHVHQYEQAGSIVQYLPLYLQEIADYGYDKAPYEVDARAHEPGAYNPRLSTCALTARCLESATTTSVPSPIASQPTR